MKTWNELKKEITFLSDIEKKEIKLKARLVNKLFKKREELGWSQNYLAVEANVDVQLVIDLEEEMTPPKWDKIIKLALTMGLTIELIKQEL